MAGGAESGEDGPEPSREIVAVAEGGRAKLLEDFQCGVCLGCLWEPLISVTPSRPQPAVGSQSAGSKTCRHMFCAQCVDALYLAERDAAAAAARAGEPPRPSGSSALVKCPNCKEPHRRSDWKPLAEIEPNCWRMLGKVRIYCPLYHGDGGCAWQGEYQDAAAHLEKGCKYARTRCQFCKASVPVSEWTQHQGDCVRWIQCRYCTEKFLTSNRLAHEGVCPRFMVVCPHGCGATFARQFAPHHEGICPEKSLPCPLAAMTLCPPVPRKQLADHLANVKLHEALMASPEEPQKQVERLRSLLVDAERRALGVDMARCFPVMRCPHGHLMEFMVGPGHSVFRIHKRRVQARQHGAPANWRNLISVGLLLYVYDGQRWLPAKVTEVDPPAPLQPNAAPAAPTSAPEAAAPLSGAMSAPAAPRAGAALAPAGGQSVAPASGGGDGGGAEDRRPPKLDGPRPGGGRVYINYLGFPDKYDDWIHRDSDHLAWSPISGPDPNPTPTPSASRPAAAAASESRAPVTTATAAAGAGAGAPPDLPALLPAPDAADDLHEARRPRTIAAPPSARAAPDVGAPAAVAAAAVAAAAGPSTLGGGLEAKGGAGVRRVDWSCRLCGTKMGPAHSSLACLECGTCDCIACLALARSKSVGAPPPPPLQPTEGTLTNGAPARPRARAPHHHHHRGRATGGDVMASFMQSLVSSMDGMDPAALGGIRSMTIPLGGMGSAEVVMMSDGQRGSSAAAASFEENLRRGFARGHFPS